MFHYTVETTMPMKEAALKLEEHLKEDRLVCYGSLM